MSLQLEYINGINPPLPIDDGEVSFKFSYVDHSNNAEICTVIDRDGSKFRSVAKFKIKDDRISILRKIKDINDVDDKINSFFEDQFSILAKGHQRLLNLILQELQIEEAHYLSSGSSRWSLDGNVWLPKHSKLSLRRERLIPLNKLNESWRLHLQNLLDSSEEPFLASIHLREAQRNLDDRFSWVQAAIAAELAVKEALVRLEPRLEPLLNEVPSPPLSKLYGSLLKTYGGEKSPYVSKLQKGAEIRNHLVHRILDRNFGNQETADYLSIVDQALRHLIILCRNRPARERS